MRKSKRALGTRDLIKFPGIRKGILAFLFLMIVSIVLMWVNVIGLTGVSIILACGVVLFSFLARSDIMEQRKLNKEDGVRRI